MAKYRRKRLLFLFVVQAVFLVATVSFVYLSWDSQTQRISAEALRKSRAPGITCESPSLPRGSIHVVVAGYTDVEAGLGIMEGNYLWDLGLTNADIFWYRRLGPEEPLRQLDGPCGMRLHERLLLPNYGRDGAALYDYILEHYDHPPRALVFLHGHGAVAWHTNCQAVFSRTAFYYRDLVRPKLTNETRVQDIMLHLVAKGIGPPQSGKGGNLQPCKELKARWPSYFDDKDRVKCCGTFIVPGERIRRVPKLLWHDLKSMIMDEQYADQGRPCFEHCIWHLLRDENVKANTRDALLSRFQTEADNIMDDTLGKRIQTCQRVSNQLKMR